MKIEKFKIFENKIHENKLIKVYFDAYDNVHNIKKELDKQEKSLAKIEAHIISKIYEWFVINKDYIFKKYNMQNINSTTRINWFSSDGIVFRIGFSNGVILSLKDSDIEDLMLYLDDPEFYNNIKNYNL